MRAEEKDGQAARTFLAVDRVVVVGQVRLPGLLGRVSALDFIVPYSCCQRFVGSSVFPLFELVFY